MNRLLIIEDEQDLLDSMVDYLEPIGYSCVTASTYREALSTLDLYDFYCALIDLNLPDGDGLDIIQKLKENESKTGIIIISARDTVEDRIKGLEMGADDYLVKPFHLSELVARVQSIIRRLRFEGKPIIQMGLMMVDPEERMVQFKDSEFELTRKELDILLYLISNKNRVITKESIAEHIWGDMSFDMGGYDSVYTHIKNLRKKLLDHTGSDWVQTVYGVGYKLTDHS